MDDLIVAQVDWYMGRVNLASDVYLKERMDDDLWVDLSVILDFPKMIRLGVHDKVSLAALLHARSSIVQVDLTNHRIRPAWARRSTLVMPAMPPETTLDDVLALLQKDSHNPQGLLSVQPAAEGLWLAIFDSPTGAQTALPLVKGKTLHSVKMNPEVHVDNFSTQPHDSSATAQQSPVPPFARAQSPAIPQSQISRAPVFVPARNITPNAREPSQSQPQSTQPSGVTPALAYTPVIGPPMPMPVPVMHHAPDGIHAQYAYAPSPGYIAPGYAPPNVQVSRQFMGPRGLAAAPASYIMGYAQGSHSFDPPAMTVGAQGAAVQQVQVPVDAAAAGEPGKSANPAIGTTANSPDGGKEHASKSDTTPASAASSLAKDAGSTADSTSDAVGGYVQNKTGQYPTNSVGEPGARDSAPIMVVGKGPMDPHYLHRGAVIADPNAIGLAPSMGGLGYAPYPRGVGRGQGSQRGDRHSQRNYGDGGRGVPRGSGGSPTDPSGRPQANRKGKKANRSNSSRHAHGERHNDTKGDGKAEGNGSLANREGGRPREEKPKPEPNFNSMHFPPLPMANDTAPTGAAQVSPSKPKEAMPVQTEVLEPRALTTKTSTGDANAGSKIRPDSKADSQDAASLDTNTSAVSEVRDSVADSLLTEGGEKAEPGVSGATHETSKASANANVPEDQTKDLRPSKAAEIGIPVSSQANGAGMSYAAILRSKKPSRPSVSIQLPRMRSDSSAKSGNTLSSGDGSDGILGQNGKDRNARRRKATSLRIGQTVETVMEGDGSNIQSSSTDKSASERSSTANVQLGTRDLDTVKAKAHSEAARPNSVWANKPKSLFQAASVVPGIRSSLGSAVGEVRKAISPIPFQEDDVGGEKLEGQNRMLDVNGQGESASVETQGTAVTDVSSNAEDLGDVNQVSLRKGLASGASEPESSTKSNRVDQAGANGKQTNAKGAWAMGGPKGWPKNHGNGNGVLERSSSTADS